MEPETEKRITPGKIAKILALIFIFSVCGLFVRRCCMVADKSRFSSPAPTEALRAAFADGESGIKTVKVSAELADDGYFAAYAVFFPDVTISLCLRYLLIFRWIGIPAWFAFVLWMLLQGLMTLLTFHVEAGVAYGAHLGGALFGLAVGFLLRNRVRNRMAAILHPRHD